MVILRFPATLSVLFNVACFLIIESSNVSLFPLQIISYDSKSLLQKSFAERCFALIEEHAPGFISSIIDYDMLTPPDLEREIGLTGKLR